jgi:hypothetical protein
LPSAYGKKFATHREAMGEVIDWLTFYNHRRLHSTLGHQSDEVRSKLARGPGKQGRVKEWLWTRSSEGKVIPQPAPAATPNQPGPARPCSAVMCPNRIGCSVPAARER